MKFYLTYFSLFLLGFCSKAMELGAEGARMHAVVKGLPRPPRGVWETPARLAPFAIIILMVAVLIVDCLRGKSSFKKVFFLIFFPIFLFLFSLVVV